MHLPCVAKYFQSNAEPRCPHCNDYWPHEIPGVCPQPLPLPWPLWAGLAGPGLAPVPVPRPVGHPEGAGPEPHMLKQLLLSVRPACLLHSPGLSRTQQQSQGV